jgi:hypothetical protein
VVVQKVSPGGCVCGGAGLCQGHMNGEGWQATLRLLTAANGFQDGL